MQSEIQLAHIICGTRPELIKILPILDILKNNNLFITKYVHSGQHSSLFDDTAYALGFTPDFRLQQADANGELAKLTSILISRISAHLKCENPDIVVVHGDTATSLCAAICAAQKPLPIVHVEAGRRTFDKTSPFPEEINRRIISQLADLHVVTDNIGKSNLEAEGISLDRIFSIKNPLPHSIKKVSSRTIFDNRGVEKSVLCTFHRRENLGKNLDIIINCIRNLAQLFKEVNFKIIEHPNPQILSQIRKLSKNTKNVTRISSMPYDNFLCEVINSTTVLTDSSGVFEECGILNVPAVSLRTKVENCFTQRENLRHINPQDSMLETKLVDFLKFNIDLISMKKIAYDETSFEESVVNAFNGVKNYLNKI